MKALKRWLGIIFLCRAGLHKHLESEIEAGIRWERCPRCKTTWVTRHGYRFAFSRPNAWEVAHGQFDLGLHP